MALFDTIGKLKRLTQQLYPTGRAWKMPEGGQFEKLHTALNLSEKRAYEDAMSTLNVILADNSEFTVEDAERWEERLGMIVNSSLDLAERKVAILRKYNHPGTIPARQNWQYLQEQLQSAGFNVYVYENIFSDGLGGFETQSPTDILGSYITTLWEHGSDAEMGVVEHGTYYEGSVYDNCVANYIDEDIDQWFNTGDNLRNTFFIAGPYIDTFADVDVTRKDEFRQLILRIKPVQTVGFLFVNYI